MYPRDNKMAACCNFGGKSIVNRVLFDAAAITLILYAFCTSVEASSPQPRNSSMYYVCPPKFLRLGSSCYYFSASAASWQEAHFSCKDRESNLTAPKRWEDRNLRNYLNRPEISKVERWIGGIYDWSAKTWKWGGQMRMMKYQSFSRMEKKSPEELKWHCIAMDPVIFYRWAPRNCLDPKHYICQTPLRRVERRERNRLRQKWGDEPNEITAPRLADYDSNFIHKDDNDIVPIGSSAYVPRNNRLNKAVEIDYNGRKRGDEYSINNVTPDPVVPTDPKFLSDKANEDRRSNDFAHRPRAHRRIPFKGYIRNRKNPEAAYRHNIAALRSGKTGLSNAEIDKNLRRLERMRKREQNRRRNLLRKREEQSGLQAEESSQVENRRTGRKVGRTIKAGHKVGPQLRSLKPIRRRGNRRGKSHSLDNVTQRTITMENALSASSELHPKVIVEIHDFKGGM